MYKWYQIFHKNSSLNPYLWAVLYILPFYFIFRASPYEIVLGVAMIVCFFVCYMLSFVSKGWQVYFWTSMQILISIAMTVMFGYVYFSLFLAFFIGNIQHRAGFITLYTIHVATTIATINYGFVTRDPVILTQLPFVLVSLIGVLLLPVTTYNKNKQEKLQVQLEDANKRISELVKLEERQRIARDLHDTLGQRLSLIGLKTDLAAKLIGKHPAQARKEMEEVRQTARSALKEVRQMVSQMRGTKVEDELLRLKQILEAAQIEFILEGEPQLKDTSLIVENVVSMCLKEAVTNVVRHSSASVCTIMIEPSRSELCVQVKDNGIGMSGTIVKGNGLRGMEERLDFVNGSLEIVSDQGTTIVIRVPNQTKQPSMEVDS